MSGNANNQRLGAHPATHPQKGGSGRDQLTTSSGRVDASAVVRTDAAIDRRVASVAGRQDGAISHRQLRTLGLSKDAIHHRVRTGRLHRVHRGVYVVGHTSPTELGPAVAALLAVGDGAVLSHASALWLHGLRPAAPQTIDVTVARPGAHTRPGIRVHRVGALDRTDVQTRRGLPVTTPPRTILDLAATLPSGDLDALYERARVARLVTPASARALLERRRGRAGTARLARIVRERPGLTRSAAERRLLDLLRRGGLRSPETNVRVAGHEVDMLWRAERLIVEIDGFAWHGDRAAFERDRRRDADLQAQGYRVLRITWRRLVDEPEAVLVTLARMLAAPR